LWNLFIASHFCPKFLVGNYISIDESKKRKSPLILVGVVMPTPAFDRHRTIDQLIGPGNPLWPSGDSMSKERDLLKVSSMLPKYDFHYLAFEANSELTINGLKVRLGYNVSMAIALDTLISACMPLDFALIDGDISNPTREWLAVFRPTGLEYKAMAKADEHYPAVNVADSLAYAIAANYPRETKNRLKFAPGEYSELLGNHGDESLYKRSSGHRHLR
jgi:hypothetical protein